MSKNRISWLDMTRGIGIISVVIIHSILYKFRDQMFYSVLFDFLVVYVMPLFLFVSGWLFESGKNKYFSDKLKAIKNKFFRMMIPYFSFSIINYSLIILALKIPFLAPVANMGSTDFSSGSILDYIFQILTYQGSMCKNLWFLYLLFILETLHILFPKFMAHPITTAILFCLPFLQHTFELPTIVQYFCAYSAYFSIGRLVFTFNDKIFSFKKSIVAIVGVFFVAATVGVYSLKFYGIFDGAMEYALVPIKAVLALSAIFTICNLCKMLSNTKADGILSFFGIRSMEIYLMHFPFITQGSTALIVKMIPSVPPFCASLAGIILGLAVPVLLSDLIIKKIPVLRFILFGVPVKKRVAK